MAYKLLYVHYLGPNNVDYMAGKAEKILAGSTYHGEKCNWTFEKYALLHLKQHQIFKSLISHGYTGIDPGLKVCHLNSGIKTNILDAVKSQTISDEALHTDFAHNVTLYKDFVKQSVNMANMQMGIASLNVASTNKGEDHWYTHNEWKDLPEDKYVSIWKACAARKSKANGSKRPSPKKGKTQQWEVWEKGVSKIGTESPEPEASACCSECCGSQV
jgi:hypothetical protein